MATLNIIIHVLLYITIIYGDEQLIDREQLRQSLQNKADNPLCGCYNISLTNVAPSATNNNHFCYTYSIKYNNDINICHNNHAINIMLGICTHERPKFTSRKLRKSLISITPDDNYYAKAMKLHRSSMLGIQIENDINIFNNHQSEEITLCMKNINADGVTSDRIQYTLHNGDIISCANHPNLNGLPCIGNQGPTPKPTKNPITVPDEDDDSYSQTWLTTSKTPTNKPTPEPTLRPTSIAPTIPPTIMPKSPVDGDVIDDDEYEICVNEMSLIQGLHLTIKKHKSLNMNTMIIEMNGPFDEWFAFGFGESIMKDSYAISVENTEFNVFERILPASNEANNMDIIDPSSWNVDDLQMIEMDGKRIITITRPWNTVENTYDFTSFFECNINFIPIISAVGNGLSIAYHKNRKHGNISNSCDCHNPPTTTPTTMAMTMTTTPTFISDICIGFDQSCNLNENECNVYIDWIDEFIISMDDGTGNIMKRICLLGISQGIQVLISLAQDNDIMLISQIIREQTCGQTSTNLYDALEVAQLEFDTIQPRGDVRSMVIFSNCKSTNANGDEDENIICETFNPLQTEIDVYIINIQSIDGTFAGDTNINVTTYLNCLTDDDQNRIVGITSDNFDDAQNIIATVSNQIILNQQQIFDDGDADFFNVIRNVVDSDKQKLSIGGIRKAFSRQTMNIIKLIFVISLICIGLNGICCTFCALRQSGTLDECFGKIDIGLNTDLDDCVLFVDDTLSDVSFYEHEDVTDNISLVAETESCNMFDDDDPESDNTLVIDSNDDDYDDDETSVTSPVPASIDSFRDDDKVKKHLKAKQSQKNFDKFFFSEAK